MIDVPIIDVLLYMLLKCSEWEQVELRACLSGCQDTELCTCGGDKKCGKSRFWN